MVIVGSRMDWMEELRTGRYAESFRVRAVCQVEESSY